MATKYFNLVSEFLMALLTYLLAYLFRSPVGLVLTASKSLQRLPRNSVAHHKLSASYFC